MIGKEIRIAFTCGIEIGAAETTATEAGARVFSVNAGDQVLATDFDLVAAED